MRPDIDLVGGVPDDGEGHGCSLAEPIRVPTAVSLSGGSARLDVHATWH